MRRSDAIKLAGGAAYVLVLGAVVYGIEGLLSSYRLGALALGLMAVLLLGGRMGLRADESETATGTSLLLRTLRGLALGLGLALVLLGLGAVLGWVRLQTASPSAVGLVLGLAVPSLQAARDELLFRGVPLTIMRGKVADRYAVPFVALLGAAPQFLLPGVTLAGLCLVTVSGLVFAMLWRLGRGLYLGMGAHAGWLFMITAGSRGLLFDASVHAGSLVPLGKAWGPMGWTAVALYAMAAIGAVVYVGRRGRGWPSVTHP